MISQERMYMGLVDKLLGKKEYLAQLDGMHCNKCIERLHNNVSKLRGVKVRRVNLDRAMFIVKPEDLQKLSQKNIGYEIVDIMEI